MAVLAPSNPSGDVGRKIQANVIRGGDLANQAVYSTDFDSRFRLPCPFCENGTGGVSVSQDKGAACTVSGGDVVRVVGALVCLAATRRRLYHDECCIGTERRADTLITHGSMSVMSSRPIALRTALQKGIS